jgi:hypothetical protein
MTKACVLQRFEMNKAVSYLFLTETSLINLNSFTVSSSLIPFGQLPTCKRDRRLLKKDKTCSLNSKNNFQKLFRNQKHLTLSGSSRITVHRTMSLALDTKRQYLCSYINYMPTKRNSRVNKPSNNLLNSSCWMFNGKFFIWIPQTKPKICKKYRQQRNQSDLLNILLCSDSCTMIVYSREIEG